MDYNIYILSLREQGLLLLLELLDSFLQGLALHLLRRLKELNLLVQGVEELLLHVMLIRGFVELGALLLGYVHEAIVHGLLVV
jgi:hypothetical protein